MATLFSYHNLAVFFGLLGNIVSFLVFLSPLPTFYNIYKAKSTQGFQYIPYSVALFSAMLTLYYGLVMQANGTLLITINSIGIAIQSFYLTVYMIFAPKHAKLKTVKLLLSFNLGLLGLIILLTALLAHGAKRESIIGWICAIFSVCCFASPLCVISTVIKTKSVEFMPFWLSFSLTISAVMWFLYGFFIKDLFVALPNVLGLLFGITQMTLYFIYRDPTKKNAVVRQATPPATAVDTGADDTVKVSELVVIDLKQEEDSRAGNRISCKRRAVSRLNALL